MKLKVIKKTNILIILSSIVLALVAGKVFYTSIITNKIVSKKALDLWERSFPLVPSRGLIRDRNKNSLVENKPALSVAVIPYQIKDKEETAKKLSDYLDVSYSKIYEKISKKASIITLHPEGKKLDYDKAIDIKQEGMEGVYLIKDVKRYYPYEERLSSLLGFVGIDNIGLSGVESYYDEYLKGVEGSLNYVTDAKGGAMSGFKSRVVAPQMGFNLDLTIDINIQNVLENEMDLAMAMYEPEEIIALAISPKTGEILGIGNRPTYNSNSYQDYSPEIYNRMLPVFSSYEPGSTFKAMTFAAALNEGVIDMYKDTYCDKGYEVVGGATIKSWKKGGHGLQTFIEVLQNSSNPGFVEISRRLGKDRMYDYVSEFGFGKKTGVDIAGESKGITFKYESFGPLEVATTAFGQGISVTPIQLVSAFNSTINGGYLLKPHVLKSVSNPSTNEVIYEYPKTVVNNPITQETSSLMRTALESVVAKGSGRKAFLDGYRVGGKTGTAQIASDGNYVEGNYVLSFIASAPMNEPEITVYFAMRKPHNCIQYGGTTVGPIIKSILSEVLPYMGVEKNYDGIEREYTWMDIKTQKVPNYIGLEKSKVKSQYFKFAFTGEGNKVIDQLPKVGERIEEGKTIWIMLGE